MKKTLPQKRHNQTLDCWKLLAALLIMGHHAVLIGESDNYIFHGAYIYTEFFFMVSGFFLVRSLEAGKVKNSSSYVKKTLYRLFPYTAVAISVQYILTGLLSGSWKQCLKTWIVWPLEIFYLTDLHIGVAQLGHLWYIAAMLFTMPIVCWVFLKDKEIFKIIIWMFPLLWYGYCYVTWGHLGHRGLFIDLIRALTGLLLGGGIFYISNIISKCEFLVKHKWAGTIIAWGSFGMTVLYTYDHYWTEYDIYCIFYFVVALVFITSKASKDIQINNDRMDFLSDLSMGIYIVHVSVGGFIQRFWGTAVTRLQKYLLYYFLTIVIAFMLLMLVKKMRKNNE